MRNKKQITSLLLAVIMMFSILLPVEMLAEPLTSESIINENYKGSLTLTKKDTEGNPLQDAGFTLYRIGDISQVIDGNTAYIEYKSLMKDSINNTIPIPTDSSNAIAESLYAQITNKQELQTDYEKFTDMTGKVTFTDLPLGVYLVYESTRPQGVAIGQSFILTIPTTQQHVGDGNDQKVWVYDIEAVPKNAFDMDKNFLVDDKGEDPSEDDLAKAEDYEIGSEIRYQIKAPVPDNIGDLKYYFIGDKLSNGLDLLVNSGNIKDLKVYGTAIDGQGNTIVIGYNGNASPYTDWTEGSGDGDAYYVELGTPRADGTYDGFTVYFNSNTLEKYDIKNIYIEYSAVLNENALVGDDTGNENDASLNYSNNPTPGQVPDKPNKPDEPDPDLNTVKPAEPPVAYTYELKLQKVNEDGNPLQNVEFELYDSHGNKIPVTKKTGTSDNIYVVDHNGTNYTLVTDADGFIYIRGLEDGQYYLKETKTAPGYTLLKEPILVQIKSESRGGDTYELVEDSDITGEGDYFLYPSNSIDKYYIRGNDGKVYELDLSNYTDTTNNQYVRMDGIVYTSYDSSTDTLSNPVQKYNRTNANNKITMESNFPKDVNGTIIITVKNVRGFELPETGGMGLSLIHIYFSIDFFLLSFIIYL